ncbi:hypothetical protein C8F01DRAFT_972932 [Mycena amicta]|nr:hypothetical protein C8F01DRAFT_972932 [Mycena amicta]
MPLFKSHPAQPDPVVTEPARKGSIFARHRSPSPPPALPPQTHRGFFGRRRSSEDSSLGSARGGSVRSAGSPSRNNHHLASIHKDPTIVAAREKVTIAEKAEVAADHALSAARAMVREAREHVRILEREAAEEHKRARAKQAVANDVSKSAAGLGRHG